MPITLFKTIIRLVDNIHFVFKNTMTKYKVSEICVQVLNGKLYIRYIVICYYCGW